MLQRCHLEKDDQKLILQKLWAPVLPSWQFLDGGSPEPLAAVGGVVMQVPEAGSSLFRTDALFCACVCQQFRSAV